LTSCYGKIFLKVLAVDIADAVFNVGLLDCNSCLDEPLVAGNAVIRARTAVCCEAALLLHMT